MKELLKNNENNLINIKQVIIKQLVLPHFEELLLNIFIY